MSTDPATDPTQRLVVALVEYPNGMATWCWEAALALQARDQPVLLIVSPGANVPADAAVEVVRFQAAAPPKPTPGPVARIARKFAGASAGPIPFLPELDRFLRARNVTPTGYFLNGSHLLHPAVDVPQYVAAWSYPSHLRGYLSKVGRLSNWQSVKGVVSMALGLIGWWRKDWRAYRQAAGVMAVSNRLGKQLTARGVRNVQVVHPGTALETMEAAPLPAESGAQVSLLIAALDLEEPRKRVEWMVRALAGLPPERFRLTLAGKASVGFQARVEAMLPGVVFTGVLSREETLHVMREQDVFLMGSCLDDWGYVLIEAMAHGLMVIAAKQTPFDEIIGDAGLLYSTNSPVDFARQVRSLEKTAISRMKHASVARASALFSRQAFGEALVRVLR